MCLSKYTKYAKCKKLCQTYFSAETTQFKYRAFYFQMTTVVLIYRNRKAFKVYLRQCIIRDKHFLQVFLYLITFK